MSLGDKENCLDLARSVNNSSTDLSYEDVGQFISTFIMLTRPGPTLTEETGGLGIVGFYQHFGEYGVVRLLAPASIIERLGTLPIGVGQL